MKHLKNNYPSYIVIIGALLFMGLNMYNLDFSDLSFSNKNNSYSGILAMFLLIIAMVLTVVLDFKKK